MLPPGHGAQVPPPANGAAATPSADPPEPPAPTIADVFALLKAQSEKHDARIGDMGRQIAKLKGAAVSDPQSQQATPTSSTPASAERRAVIAIQRHSIGLPEAALEHLEQMEADGATPSEILREIKAIKLGMGLGAIPGEQAGGTPAPSKTRDKAATAPPRTAVQHPRTLSEYYQLAREHPEQKKLLDKDPTFHPEDLPHRE